MRKLPDLPTRDTYGSSMVLGGGTILLTGEKRCYQLEKGIWKEHSTLNKPRLFHSAVSTNSATFLFGGRFSRHTYEYLPKDSTTWVMGKTEIPIGFEQGCAIAMKSEKEIWLIGGVKTKKRILSFNVNDHTFHVLDSELNIGRIGHMCAIIPNTKKLMITGGNDAYSLGPSEIINIEDGIVTMASSVKSSRSDHGMGFVTINNEDRLVIFGGQKNYKKTKDCIEIYNAKADNWETSCFKLKKPLANFDFLTVKLGQIQQF